MQALVVVPTRELCVQVTEDLELAAKNRATKIVSIYGGKAYEGQIEQLKAGAQIVVGTPGRLLDLASQRLLSLKNVQEMVLDEADKMLDLGFLSDIEKLFAQTPATRHTMLFSATMPGPIVALARRFMNRPIHIRATDPDEGLTQANIKHVVYRAHNMDKDEVIARILQAEGRGKTVIFTRTKRAAAKLVEELGDRGFNAAAVHGDLNQEQRERAMAAFKAGKKDILIATDVAARGIDVEDVTHVINHTIPEDENVPAPCRPHRPGRQDRHRRDLRRLGRPAQVGADKPRARLRPAGADGDLLVLTAPLRRLEHPDRRQGPTEGDAREGRRRRRRLRALGHRPFGFGPLGFGSFRLRPIGPGSLRLRPRGAESQPHPGRSGHEPRRAGGHAGRRHARRWRGRAPRRQQRAAPAQPHAPPRTPGREHRPGLDVVERLIGSSPLLIVGRSWMPNRCTSAASSGSRPGVASVKVSRPSR